MENEGNAGTASSSRWNPMKEQITLLENLYKQGYELRAPIRYSRSPVGCVLMAISRVKTSFTGSRTIRLDYAKSRSRSASLTSTVSSTKPPVSSTLLLAQTALGCVSPYYLQQVGDCQANHHGSLYTKDLLHSNNNTMIPSGGYEKRTISDHKKQLSDITSATTRMSMSSRSLRFDRFALRDHGYYGWGINVNSNGRETLPFFPLQPLDATNDYVVGNSSFAPGNDSPVVCDDGGREQQFIDFFSGGSSRFDNNGNAL